MMLALACGVKNSVFLLEGEGVVILASLAVSDQVACLFAQPEQRLRIRPADGAMVPAADATGKESKTLRCASDFDTKLQQISSEDTLTTGSPEAWTGLCAQRARGCSGPARTFWC